MMMMMMTIMMMMTMMMMMMMMMIRHGHVSSLAGLGAHASFVVVHLAFWFKPWQLSQKVTQVWSCG